VTRTAVALLLSSLALFGQNEALLLRVRARTMEYVRDLGNFTCTRVMVRHRGEAGKDKWKLLETTEEEITSVNGRDQVRLIKLNGKPAPEKVNWKWTPYRSAGDFSSSLRSVFDPDSFTQFQWKGMEGEDYVWEFEVAQKHSKMALRVNAWAGYIPYFGSFRVDPKTAQVKQLRVDYSEPAGQPVSSVKTLVYEPVHLGGREFLLPTQVEETARYRNGLTRIRSTLTNYRRFEAESTIIPGAEVTSPSKPAGPGQPLP
jgi:hypothetical protein